MLPLCVVARHDLSLVLLASLICTATVVLTAWLLPRARVGWLTPLLVGTLLALGAWTTHFVAMLGYEPGLSMTYDPVLTLASAGVALGGVWLSLLLWQRQPSWAGTCAGAAAGLAIGFMHYLGMAAVSVPGTLNLSTSLAVLSLAAAAFFGGAAFRRLHRARAPRDRFAAAGLLLLCIVVLHFTGMAAISITSDAHWVPNGQVRSWLAWVTGVTGVLLALCSAGVMTMLAMARRRSNRRDAARLREMADASSEALIICDASRTVVDVNQQFLDLCVLDRAVVVGGALRHVFEEGAPVPSGPKPELTTLRNGVPVEGQLRTIGSGDTGRLVVSLRDVRERVQAEQEIRHLARHDMLTGLANRFALMERLGQEVERHRRDESQFAVFYIDLDRFKPINDMYGHAAGDELLRQVADRLQSDLRTEDLAARLGGDEFAVVQGSFPSGDPGRTVNLATRLIQLLSSPYTLGSSIVSISCSVGIALYPGDGEDAEALLRGADIALYRAKESGRSTLAFFRQDMEQALTERHSLEQDLRSAIGKGELSLAWQPQATADGSVVVGFEALLRWRHKVRGNVPPDVFIPIAEKSGIILLLGAWALRAACAEAAGWANALRVAVNVSPVQIQQPGFATMTAQILSETGLDPSRLELEVTESLFLTETERVLSALDALKRQGIRVSLDDFGTGYSSLATLRRFPFDKIKLDRSFVSRMTDDTQSAAIVHAVLGLSRGLGLPVVAEGVETVSQLEALQDAECHEVQGYLIGKPRPIDDFRELTGRRASERVNEAG